MIINLKLSLLDLERRYQGGGERHLVKSCFFCGQGELHGLSLTLVPHLFDA